MKAQELIDLNNQKRELLTEENKKYYEDMLIYLRLSFQKSERETEELLNELLDHLLEAQEEGKDVKELFGDNPKQYANELLGEMPKAITKDMFGLFLLATVSFFASVLLFKGVINSIIYYVFGKGDEMQEVFLGSAIVESIVSLVIAFVFLYAVISYLKWATFKNLNKFLDFFYTWLIGVVSFGIYFVLFYFLPGFGPRFEIPIYTSIIAGVLLGLVGYGIYKVRGKFI